MTEEKTEEAEVTEVEQVEILEVKAEEPKKDVDHNWQEANRVMKLQQQEIAELRNMMQRIPPPKEEPDEFAKLDPEGYLTVADARKMAEKTAAKQAEVMAKKYVQEYAQQQTLANDEQRARDKYDDYDYVLETYAIPLIKNDPALAYKIQSSKNPAMTAYKLGKLSDDYEESMTKQATSPKAEKILKNSQRPVSGNAIGSPLKTQADSFSKMSKDEVWAQSQKFARQA
jgi:hypothetical protein